MPLQSRYYLPVAFKSIATHKKGRVPKKITKARKNTTAGVITHRRPDSNEESKLEFLRTFNLAH